MPSDRPYTLDELAAGSTGGRKYIEAGLARLPAGELHTDGHAAAVLDAAAPLIAARVRREVAEEIAQDIEIAQGDRCPTCRGKPEAFDALPADVQQRARQAVDADPAIIAARQHASPPTEEGTDA